MYDLQRIGHISLSLSATLRAPLPFVYIYKSVNDALVITWLHLNESHSRLSLKGLIIQVCAELHPVAILGSASVAGGSFEHLRSCSSVRKEM